MSPVSVEHITRSILILREQRVLPDSELADRYGAAPEYRPIGFTAHLGQDGQPELFSVTPSRGERLHRVEVGYCADPPCLEPLPFQAPEVRLSKARPRGADPGSACGIGRCAGLAQ